MKNAIAILFLVIFSLQLDTHLSKPQERKIQTVEFSMAEEMSSDLMEFLFPEAHAAGPTACTWNIVDCLRECAKLSGKLGQATCSGFCSPFSKMALAKACEGFMSACRTMCRPLGIAYSKCEMNCKTMCALKSFCGGFPADKLLCL